MSDNLPAKIDEYYAALFIRGDEAQQAAQNRIDQYRLPPISVPPLHGQFLMMLARLGNAKRILELGTLGGYSTIWLAKALPEDGELVTLEVRTECAAIAQANIDEAKLPCRVKIHVAPALDTLDAMIAGGEAPFDFIFIDADKPNYHRYLERVLRLARPGTIIIADNVVLNGEIVEENSANHGVRAMRKMNEAIAANPKLTATMIQTTGTKGHDGFAMIVVEE